MVKLGSDSIATLAREYIGGPFGLSFFMAWIYAMFYSTMVWVGGSTVFSSEYPWVVSMTISGMLGIIGCLVFGLRATRPISVRPWVYACAALLCAAGTIIVANIPPDSASHPMMTVVGATLTALGFAALTIAWGSRISTYDDAMIEFSIPMSFIVARIIFAVMGMLAPGVVFALAALLPLISVLFLINGVRLSGHKEDATSAEPEVNISRAPHVDSPCSDTSSARLLHTRGIVAATLVLLVFRIGYGVVRALGTGSSVDGPWQFLTVFALPVAVFGIFVVLALTAARSLTTSLVIRWVLPVLLLALAFIPLDGTGEHQFAGVMNSIASIILQAFFWILLAKAAHRRPGSGPFFFSCYLVGLCLGMSVGVVIGLQLLEHLDTEGVWLALPFITCALVASIMALQGKAHHFGTDACERRAEVSSEKSDASEAEDMLDIALKEQAHRMAETYKLSPREEEIVAFLLAGRNRPYIRDVLFISLNTVNTHIKNVFMKIDIHSHQELLDLARSEFPIRF